MAPLVGPGKADAPPPPAATPASTVRRITKQDYPNVRRVSGLDITRTMRFSLYPEAEQEQAIRNVIREYSFLNQNGAVDALNRAINKYAAEARRTEKEKAEKAEKEMDDGNRLRSLGSG
jgi:hypothetical protein